jgi:hypothetical protein
MDSYRLNLEKVENTNRILSGIENKLNAYFNKRSEEVPSAPHQQ